jgi:hypothetical protein
MSLVHDVFTGRFLITVTLPNRSEMQSPTGSHTHMKCTIKSMVSASSAVSGIPLMDIIPIISDFQSLSRSSTGSLSLRPSLCSCVVDNGVISNQTIIYPGDSKVIPPNHISSLQCTTSMTDLGEEFESTLWWAKDVRPGLGFGLGLAKPQVCWMLILNHAAGLIFLGKNIDYDDDEDIYDDLNLDDDDWTRSLAA